MNAIRQDDSRDAPMEVDSASLAQLRRFGTLLGRLPKDCSATLGSRTRTGSGPDNRKLTFANYAGLMLLAVLHPGIQSLRDMQRASELERVRKALVPPEAPSADRVSLGSLSESVRAFDPALLQPIIAELAGQLPKYHDPGQPLPHDVPLDLLQKVVAVDGSCLRGLAQIYQAANRPKSGKESGKSAWRMHMQFRPLTNLPDPTHPAVLTPDRTAPGDDERAVLARHLQAECVYVGDRGYEKYNLFNAVVKAGSDYVVRVQMRSMQVLETRPITAEARAAGVIEDQIVTASRGLHPSDATLTHRVRRIVIQPPVSMQGKPRANQTSTSGPPEQIVLLTSLVDVPAEVVGTVYRLRWTIETFFRFFKHVLGLNQLLSTRRQGVEIQIAISIIAALLMVLTCGRPPGRTGTFALQMLLQGLASEAEAQALLQRDEIEQSRRKTV